MEPKVGDRVFLDAKKVGQPRRSGVVRSVTKGLSGARYQIRWDDGAESMIFPGAGILRVESNGARGRPARKASRKGSAKAPKASAKKARASGGKSKRKPAKGRRR